MSGLYAHQKEAFERFKDASEAALFLEMGLGKSATALAIAQYRREKGDIDRLLIVAPNDVHVAWVKEQLPLWLHCKYEAQCFGGRGGQKELHPFYYDDVLQVISVNIDTFSTERKWKELPVWIKTGKGMIILDEATCIKNHAAKRTQRLLYEFNDVVRKGKRVLSSAPHTVMRIILTGTPATNGSYDFHPMMEFLRPGFFGMNYYTFQNYYGMLSTLKLPTGNVQVPINAERWAAIKRIKEYYQAAAVFGVSLDTWQTIQGQEKYEGSYKHLDELKALVDTVAMYKLLEDCVDMPERNYVRRVVAMSDEQAAAYKSMEAELLALYGGAQTTAANKITAMIRLQQISSGFIVNTMIQGTGTSEAALVRGAIPEGMCYEDAGALANCGTYGTLKQEVNDGGTDTDGSLHTGISSACIEHGLTPHMGGGVNDGASDDSISGDNDLYGDAGGNSTVAVSGVYDNKGVDDGQRRQGGCSPDLELCGDSNNRAYSLGGEGVDFGEVEWLGAYATPEGRRALEERIEQGEFKEVNDDDRWNSADLHIGGTVRLRSSDGLLDIPHDKGVDDEADDGVHNMAGDSAAGVLHSADTPGSVGGAILEHLLDDADYIGEAGRLGAINFEETDDIMPGEVVWLGKEIPKMQALFRDIAECAKPCIVVTRFSAEAAKIYEALESCYSTCLMTGWKKVGTIQEFQEGRYEVMVANIRVISKGFNLQNAHQMFFYSNTFSLEDRLQAEGRIFRIGQKNVCSYTDYVNESTIDTKVVGALRQKRALLDYIRGTSVKSFIEDEDEVTIIEGGNE